MERIMPLNEKQIKSLHRYELSSTNKPFRILTNGCAINIVTGFLSPKGTNIMYHPVYWDRPKEFVSEAIGFLQVNNPKLKFTVFYH